MGVSEQEHHWSFAQLFVEGSEILSELLLFIPSGEGDLEHVAAGDIGR